MENRKMRHITRGAKKYIKQAINDTGSDNLYDICEQMSETLENTFSGDTLDYQLREDRMDLATTGKIMDAIETYMYNYLSDDDKERIKEGYKIKENLKQYVLDKGVNLDNPKFYTPQSLSKFNKTYKGIEKKLVNLNTSEEEKDILMKELDNSISNLELR